MSGLARRPTRTGTHYTPATIAFSAEDLERIDAIAHETGASVSAVVRETVRLVSDSAIKEAALLWLKNKG